MSRGLQDPSMSGLGEFGAASPSRVTQGGQTDVGSGSWAGGAMAGERKHLKEVRKSAFCNACGAVSPSRVTKGGQTDVGSGSWAAGGAMAGERGNIK